MKVVVLLISVLTLSLAEETTTQGPSSTDKPKPQPHQPSLQRDNQPSGQRDNQPSGQQQSEEYRQLEPDEVKALLLKVVDENIDKDKDKLIRVEELKEWLRVLQERVIQDNVERQWAYYNPQSEDVLSWEGYYPEQKQVVTWERYKNYTYPDEAVCRSYCKLLEICSSVNTSRKHCAVIPRHSVPSAELYKHRKSEHKQKGAEYAVEERMPTETHSSEPNRTRRRKPQQEAKGELYGCSYVDNNIQCIGVPEFVAEGVRRGVDQLCDSSREPTSDVVDIHVEDSKPNTALKEDAPETEELKEIKDMIRRAERRWKNADVDGDGNLSKEEFRDYIHPEESQRAGGVVVEEAMEDMDLDKNGEVSLEEYMNHLQKVSGPEKEDPQWAAVQQGHFANYLDKNKDGSLDKEEMKEWVVPSYDRSEAEAWRLVSIADVDQDSKLTREDIANYYEYYLSLLPPEYWVHEDPTESSKHDEF